jgi:hypothetical protein
MPASELACLAACLARAAKGRLKDTFNGYCVIRSRSTLVTFVLEGLIFSP